MNIIFGRDNAEKLREKYTVLDLETIEKDGVSLEAFCLIPADKVALTDMTQLESWVKLHHDFLNGYHSGQFGYCRDAVTYLMGKFGGELDSFYEEILNRIEKTENLNLTT